jgi:hypothetical protein
MLVLRLNSVKPNEAIVGEIREVNAYATIENARARRERLPVD